MQSPGVTEKFESQDRIDRRRGKGRKRVRRPTEQQVAVLRTISRTGGLLSR